MRPSVLLVDVGIAILAAIIVLTITPGLAVTGAMAIVILAACPISFRRDLRRRRARKTRQCTPRPARRDGPQPAERRNRT